MLQVMPPRAKAARPPEAVRFGAFVRKRRLAKGWTQEQLAEAAGMNELQIGHIERGASDPKLTTILKLCAALRIRPGSLLDKL